MRSLIVALIALSLAAFAAPAAASCLNFEPLPAGTSSGVGPLLSLPDGNVRLVPFQTGAGTIVTTGAGTIVASNNAGGSPTQELRHNNINIQVNPIPDVLYADFGNNVNLRVNGAFANLNDLSDVGSLVGPGTFVGTLGGVTVTVTRTTMLGFHFGAVSLDANEGRVIEVFAVGGQEFFTDDICW